ncbi:MAG TPA: DUF3465 domain-containing protein [Gemmatimonadales bacterium]|nr:DUF3465 domain-containing protein [Gemmatimonadales bacterium]
MAGLVLAAIYVARTRSPGTAAIPPAPAPAAVGPAPVPPSAAPAPGGVAVLEAFNARRSGVEVEATGVVARRLADDRKGLPHERFILRVGDLTVLVAHNTELAPVVPVAVGDTVEVRGEYEWNQLGGVIHWTHRDPDGRHAPGWIRLRGRLYQ